MNGSIVKSVGRVFEVLELFNTERASLTATAVARALKYPASSTVALLKSMVNLGYLSYDHAARTYFPTIRLAVISNWLENSFYIEGHLLELMDDITNVTGESTFLSWLNDLHMQFVRVRIGPNGTAVTPMLEPHRPLFESLVGLLALSQKRDVEIVKLAERINHLRRAGEAKVDVAAAMESIRNIRSQGYGACHNTKADGTATLAWVLRQKGSDRALVLSVVGSGARIRENEKTLVQAVKNAIKRYTGL